MSAIAPPSLHDAFGLILRDAQFRTMRFVHALMNFASPDQPTRGRRAYAIGSDLGGSWRWSGAKDLEFARDQRRCPRGEAVIWSTLSPWPWFECHADLITERAAK